ncbi:MAG: hypothetical protein BWK75_03320 [Candidatus Altiarchaeales archaeon A3]|nr:MAG: hypothetical protein BWK75_03320 [Candidatus Altiarchaeales archaeon A3]
MFEVIYVLVLAVIIDLTLGEPKDRFHPVAWLGKMISLFFKNDFISGNKKKIFKKIYGIISASILIIFCSFLVFWFLNLISEFHTLFILLSAITLKFTFSIKGMETCANSVLKDLIDNNIYRARNSVLMLVGRDTRNLNERQITSAVVESVSENMVDGIISPVFYFTIFFIATSIPIDLISHSPETANSIALAVSAAVAFRVISTLDSMVGYKNEKFIDLGWFSARTDDVFNYIPARLSLFFFLNSDSIKISLRDHGKTPSPNSGFPMAAMAGFLGVSLEKTGYYKIGDEKEQLNTKHITLALKTMKKTVMLFLIFNAALILVFYFIGLR